MTLRALILLAASCGSPSAASDAAPAIDSSLAPSSTVVVGVGDSITMGSPGFTGGYGVRLGALRPDLVFVGSQRIYPATGRDTLWDHEGYSGLAIDEIRDVSTPKMHGFAAEIVLLLAGTNDVADGVADPANYVALAEELLFLDGVETVLCSTIPPGATGTPYAAKVVPFNDALPAAFASASPGITLHDIAGALAPEQLTDGIHPNDDGYAAVARGWAAALEEIGR